MKSDACATLISTDKSRSEHLLDIARSAEAHILINKIWKAHSLALLTLFHLQHDGIPIAGMVSQSSDPNLAVCVFLV